RGPKAAAIFWQGNRYILMMLFPITLFSIAASHLGLAFWLGNSFADSASWPLALMSLSVFLNGFVQLGVTTVQASDRPDITGLFQIVELPFYIVLMLLLARRFGVAGAAFAGTIRNAAEMCFFMFASHKLVKGTAPETRTVLTALVFSSMALCLAL